jgi:hypothetical protein
MRWFSTIRNYYGSLGGGALCFAEILIELSTSNFFNSHVVTLLHKQLIGNDEYLDSHAIGRYLQLRVTLGTRAALRERSERVGSPAAAEGRRIVVPLVKLRLSPDQRVHHVTTLIVLLMVYLNLGLRSSSGDSVAPRCNLSGNCGLDCAI